MSAPIDLTASADVPSVLGAKRKAPAEEAPGVKQEPAKNKPVEEKPAEVPQPSAKKPAPASHPYLAQVKAISDELKDLVATEGFLPRVVKITAIFRNINQNCRSILSNHHNFRITIWMKMEEIRAKLREYTMKLTDPVHHAIQEIGHALKDRTWGKSDGSPAWLTSYMHDVVFHFNKLNDSMTSARISMQAAPPEITEFYKVSNELREYMTKTYGFE